jgi:hypothetical protein
MRLLIGLIVALSSVAAGQTKATKEFKPPQHVTSDPLVAPDEGCAKDLAKASRMEGLELRRFVSDLLRYGCAEWLQGPHLTNITAIRSFPVGAEKVGMLKVNLISTKTSEIKEGWILDKQVVEMGAIRRTLAILKVLDELDQARKDK